LPDWDHDVGREQVRHRLEVHLRGRTQDSRPCWRCADSGGNVSQDRALDHVIDMRADIEQAARRAQNMEDFKRAIRDIRIASGGNGISKGPSGNRPASRSATTTFTTMKLIDTEETINPGHRNRDPRRGAGPPAWPIVLKEEVDRRGAGQTFRRAIVVGDAWYPGEPHFSPESHAGNRGTRRKRVGSALFRPVATIWSQDERSFIQADFDGDVKRATLWGMDRAATAIAGRCFRPSTSSSTSF
jgi:hypothetical protein